MKAFRIVLIAAAFAQAAPSIAHETKSATVAEKQVGKNQTSETSTTKPKPIEHSGGTDANGCHTNHTTGDYHCHKPK